MNGKQKIEKSLHKKGWTAESIRYGNLGGCDGNGWGWLIILNTNNITVECERGLEAWEDIETEGGEVMFGELLANNLKIALDIIAKMPEYEEQFDDNKPEGNAIFFYNR